MRGHTRHSKQFLIEVAGNQAAKSKCSSDSVLVAYILSARK